MRLSVQSRKPDTLKIAGCRYSQKPMFRASHKPHMLQRRFLPIRDSQKCFRNRMSASKRPHRLLDGLGRNGFLHHCALMKPTASNQRRFRRKVLIGKPRGLLLAVFLAGLSLAAQTQSAMKNVFWQPDQLQPGSPVLFTIELNREAAKVSGQFLGKQLLFFRSGKPRVWYALAGVDVETTPG